MGVSDLSCSTGGAIPIAQASEVSTPSAATSPANTTFNGITIPDAGRLGWHYGTDRWSEGQFFRYRITDMTPIIGTVR